jgi:hypothetical protein
MRFGHYLFPEHFTDEFYQTIHNFAVFGDPQGGHQFLYFIHACVDRIHLNFIHIYGG